MSTLAWCIIAVVILVDIVIAWAALRALSRADDIAEKERRSK